LQGYKYPIYSETLCIRKVTLDQTVQDIKCANTTQGNYLFKYMDKTLLAILNT